MEAGGRRGERWAPGGPGTHAGSSPEGDASFDEEHPRVAAADHEQHAAEAQVDEADEDLDGLRKPDAAQPGWRADSTSPSAGRGESVQSPARPRDLPAPGK